jgi:hypothetical protein
MISRYSSRVTRLDRQFLNDKLHNAESYDRIAGYFSSSVLEIAGEAIESISGKVRLICNSQIEKEDCETATAAAFALRHEWCENEPEKVYASATSRLKRLYEFMKSGNVCLMDGGKDCGRGVEGCQHIHLPLRTSRQPLTTSR